MVNFGDGEGGSTSYGAWNAGNRRLESLRHRYRLLGMLLFCGVDYLVRQILQRKMQK